MTVLDVDLVFGSLRRQLLEAYEREVRGQPQTHAGGRPQLEFQGIYLAAMLEVAALIAIDAGMLGQAFEHICQESFRRNNGDAMRFG